MSAYYNEIDPYAAQWLRNLIAAGHIAPGEVDERSIEDVLPAELKNFTQCHFFAGIGVWSYALRRAGWPDARPVWTGSCPCQPFSAAGKRSGVADERHLWPAWFNLIRQCRPDVIFGEQVEAAINHGWLDLVQSDMEGNGYAFGAAGFPAAGVGAPHIRARLWFVAKRLEYTEGVGWQQRRAEPSGRSIVGGCGPERLADPSDGGREHEQGGGRPAGLFDATNGEAKQRVELGDNDASTGIMGIADSARSQPRRIESDRILERCGETDRPGPVNGFWSNSDWIGCRDGKWRPVESGTFPLVNGASGRVGRLRAYGNAINAEAAEAFIRAAM